MLARESSPSQDDLRSRGWLKPSSLMALGIWIYQFTCELRLPTVPASICSCDGKPAKTTKAAAKALIHWQREAE